MLLQTLITTYHNRHRRRYAETRRNQQLEPRSLGPSRTRSFEKQPHLSIKPLVRKPQLIPATGVLVGV